MNEKRTETPCTNRGVENTSEYPIIIDYITLSGHFQTFNEMIDFLGLKSLEKQFEVTSPRWFYKTAYTYDNVITLMLQQKDSITSACINISGRGCRVIESFSCFSLTDIICKCVERDGFSISRVDLAMDVIDNKFDIQTLVKNYRKGNYTCRSKFSNVMESIDDGIKGTSLYFGKKKSNIYINIYDKRAERGYKPEEFPNWTRCEIRLRGPNAQGFAQQLYDSGLNVGFFMPAYLITILDSLLIQMIVIKLVYQRRRIGKSYYLIPIKYRCSLR